MTMFELEEEQRKHFKLVNAYAIRCKDALKDEGFDPETFAHLSPALAIAALMLEVR